MKSIGNAHLSILLLACHIDDSLSFFERNFPKFPAIPRWGRTIRQARVSRVQQEDTNEDGVQNTRRNLITGSAAALASTLLGPRASSASTVILEDSEDRRIQIFERNAPSVVFIDTFAEKQDVFSPNIMEVPLGSGSGFVWDKEGHIGKYRSLLTITASFYS